MSAAAGNITNLFAPDAAVRVGGDPSSPAVSVVIPVIGDNEMLIRLLGRLRGLPVPPDEIVIVDGGTLRAKTKEGRSVTVYSPGSGDLWMISDLMKYGVQVNAIHPGLVRTPRIERTFGGRHADEAKVAEALKASSERAGALRP